jgi:HAD superfamily hydrolase (TIGR01484 family)
MLPVRGLPPAVARQIAGVFTDIDGTITAGGKLPAKAFDALWRLHDAGLRVVPVTGRPAGWCDLIAREWPVDGVVGENGALAFAEKDGALIRSFHPRAADGEVRARLDEVRAAILAEIPGARVAKDQPYRQFDLAIDFCEEPPDLGLEAAQAIKTIFERFGAHAKVSSIHVNGWFGDYDKLSMVKLFCRERWAFELDQVRERYIFCGDSPNDEPMFAYFPNACGVANIAAFAGQLKALPRFVADGSGAAGFVEIVDALLAQRRQNAK